MRDREKPSAGSGALLNETQRVLETPERVGKLRIYQKRIQ